MGNRQVDLGRAFEASWACFKQHGLWLSLVYLAIALCVGIIAFVTVGYGFLGLLLSATNGMHSWPVVSGFGAVLLLVLLVFSLLSLVVEVAMDNLGLGLMSGRYEKLTFDAAKMPVWLYAKAFAVNLLASILCALSLVLLVVPFFFIAPRIMLAGRYQLAHPEAGVVESISATWRMTEGNTLVLLLFIILWTAASFVFGQLPVIGPVVISAFCLLCTTAVYYQLAPAAEGDAKPDTGGYDKSER